MALDNEAGQPAADAIALTETAAPAEAAPVDAGKPAERTAADKPAADKPAKATVDDTLMAVWKKNNPPRNPNGKFAGTDAKATTETSETTKAEKTDTTETKLSTDQSPEKPAPEQAKPAAAQPAIEPPISWSGEMKAKWNALPPEVAAYVAQRDKESHDAITRAGSEKRALEDRQKSYEPFDQLIQAHRADFARRGLHPAQAFASLLNAQRMLDNNPLNGLVQIGLGYGIDLRQLVASQQQQSHEPGQEPAPTPPAYNPEVAALRNQVGQLTNYLTEQQFREKQAVEARQTADNAALAQEIEAFAKDKPQFDDTRRLMAAALFSGAAETLQQAYEQATWAIPSMRERILADQRKADEEKRIQDAAQRSLAATKSAAVNMRSSPVAGRNPRSMDDTLHDLARKHFPGHY